MLSLVSGSMAGSTTRLPLPSSTFGRRWCLLSHAPQTKPIFVHILAQGPVQFCTELLLLPSSKWHLSCFAPCFWKDFGCQCRSRTHDASVVSPSTHRPATEPRALGLEGCGLEHWDQNALWPECAGKQEPPCM